MLKNYIRKRTKRVWEKRSWNIWIINLALSLMDNLGIIRKKKKVNDLFISSGMILFFAAKEIGHCY